MGFKSGEYVSKICKCKFVRSPGKLDQMLKQMCTHDISEKTKIDQNINLRHIFFRFFSWPFVVQTLFRTDPVMSLDTSNTCTDLGKCYFFIDGWSSSISWEDFYWLI